MTDQPSSPAPGDEPEIGKKSKQPRSEVRKECLDEITLANEIVTAAEKPAYAAALLEGGIDAAAVAALKPLVGKARDLAKDTGGKKTAKKTATLGETKLKKALVLQIGRVQSLAIGKYERGDPKREDYYIGKKIDNSRAQLEQAALNVLTRATADTKLKAPAALLAKLAAANTAYLGAQGEQTGKTTDATTTRESLEAIINEVETARRDIQSVADATWPALEKVHGPIRKEFKIPLNRRLF